MFELNLLSHLAKILIFIIIFISPSMNYSHAAEQIIDNLKEFSNTLHQVKKEPNKLISERHINSMYFPNYDYQTLDYSNQINILQIGNNNKAEATQSGEYNSIQFQQVGNGQSAYFKQDGIHNELQIMQGSNQSLIQMIQEGFHNKINLNNTEAQISTIIQKGEQQILTVTSNH